MRALRLVSLVSMMDMGVKWYAFYERWISDNLYMHLHDSSVYYFITIQWIGSTIAQYTGQTLFKKVFESKFFEKKEYAKAMTDGFLTLDKELSEGKHLLKTKQKEYTWYTR